LADICTDRLESLLHRFPVRARLFHAGALCGITNFARSEDGGQMHLVRAGTLEVLNPGHPPLQIDTPSLLFYPRPVARRFITDTHQGAELVCAQLHFDTGAANPIVGALPDVLLVPLDRIDGSGAILNLLFDEAFGDHCGRAALVDRLFEIVLIQLLRHLMETNQIRGGMLAGLSHPKLRKALVAMHEQPQRDWSLETLAECASMSRSIFAAAFRAAVGCTPGAYLQNWRVRLTQQALMQGRLLKMIAADVGYASEAALSRAFKAQCGMTPREWKTLAPKQAAEGELHAS